MEISRDQWRLRWPAKHMNPVRHFLLEVSLQFAGIHCAIAVLVSRTLKPI